MRNNINITSIPRNQSRRHSRQIRILHPAVREGFGKDEDVVGGPFVGDDEGGGDGDEGFCVVGEFVLEGGEEGGFCVEGAAGADGGGGDVYKNV